MFSNERTSLLTCQVSRESDYSTNFLLLGFLTRSPANVNCSQDTTTRWALSKRSVDLAVRNTNSPRSSSNCGLHPLIHTLLEFTLAQNVGVSQRFIGLGSLLPQTGHTLSVALTIRLTLHLEHLTEWSLARSISSRSREVTIWLPTSPFFH